MTKVLFTHDYGEEKFNLIKAMGYEIVHQREDTEFNEEELKGIEVLVCYNPFKNLDISKLDNLKLIQLSSTGTDQIPLNKLNKNTVVSNNKGGYSIPIGEWIVMSILNLMKNTYKLFRQQENKKWKMNKGCLEVYGKKVGFLGTGTLAQEGAKRLQGFGAEIIGFNTNGRIVDNMDLCYPLEEAHKVIGKCDIVICTLPYTEKTHELINNDFISKMKDGVFFINVSRGMIINEKDLIKNLKNGKIKGAALDVFYEEPLPAENELWNLENVIISPHNSWLSEMRNERRFEGIIENLRRYKEGLEVINKVDMKEGY
ncbi:phosphoglycerate dehydrogenase [Oceanirhabdus sp. W0125-5]|uniref:phosphoglycerate dehydrogenase n=1 Tax=Oceanirhabdus sp. W0125-5 TaxID=2999116 RepID=UPI002FDEEADF